MRWPNGPEWAPVTSPCFADHLDASPLQVALSLRVQRSNRSLAETVVPFAVVAERAGYSSSRRMGDAVGRLYGRPPFHAMWLIMTEETDAKVLWDRQR